MSEVDSRRLEIMAGTSKPGPEGAFWRLMLRMDHIPAVTAWVEAEKALGTDPAHLFTAMSQVVAAEVFVTAMCVTRLQVRPAAQDMMRASADAVDHDIQTFLGKTGKQRTALHLPPGFSVIKGGGDKETK